jgi:transcriptional regulator with XRE-family HTH domain
MKTIGLRIKQIRKMIGCSQSELAARIGLSSQVQLSKIEAVKREIPNSSLVLLSELSGKSCDWILTGKEHGGCSESKEAVIECDRRVSRIIIEVK